MSEVPVDDISKKELVQMLLDERESRVAERFRAEGEKDTERRVSRRESLKAISDGLEAIAGFLSKNGFTERSMVIQFLANNLETLESWNRTSKKVKDEVLMRLTHGIAKQSEVPSDGR